MKTIQGINAVVVGVPLLFFMLSLSNKDFLLFALAFTFFTGVIQILMAIYLLTKEHLQRLLSYYFLGVAVHLVSYFFALKFGSGTLEIMVSGALAGYILAFYLTYIIQKS